MSLFFRSAVMSGMESDRYEYSNLLCDSRSEGDEVSYKLRLCLHFLFVCSLSIAANLCFATNDREECLRECEHSIGAELVSAHALLSQMCHEH
jgi:hypothetical protein